MRFAEIEHQRALREQLERTEAALTNLLGKNPEILAAGPYSRTRAAACLEARALVDHYAKVYGELETPVYTLLEKSEAMAEFEQHVEILPVDGPQESINVDAVFTPSEHYGEFLDLHEQYAIWVAEQSKPKQQPSVEPERGSASAVASGAGGARPPSYTEYLESFPHLDSSLDHLRSVSTYLESFFRRALVFEDLPVPQVGGELYCEACQRQFTTLGVYNGHLGGRKHKRAVQGTPQTDSSTYKARITAYMTTLQPILERTITDTRRQNALTPHERRAEVERQAHQVPLVSTVAGLEPPRERIGPDGKPIPQWLYKLKGLGHEFACEICGNYVYYGRQAFERHFDETRHAHGLQCLGVDSQPLYRGISQIGEVMELAKKQKRQQREDAEVEDAEGNVMTERVYQDLKNQNLI